MKRVALAMILLWLAFTLACGTAKGRYDGEDLEQDDGQDNESPADDDTSPNGADDDDATPFNPEIDDFTWIDADGNAVRLYDYADKVVLLNTGAFWCTACREETPSLQKDLWQKYRGTGEFVLIQLVVETADYQPATPATAAAWRDEFNLTYTVCADPDWSLAPWFEIEAIPFNMLLDRGMKIALTTHEYDKDILSYLIKDLL